MILDDDSPVKEEGRKLVVAIVTAAGTALATGLVTWAIDELKDRTRARREATTPPIGGDK